MLKKGDKAPSFNLPKIDGTMLSSNEYQNKCYILYFYPKDNTPGCTKQATEFSHLMTEFKELGVDIIGVNADSIESHQNFCHKHTLEVILLSDPEKQLLQAYKVWGEKKFMDKIYEGLIRSTFIINPQGIIEETMYNVKVAGHADRVLKNIKKILNHKS
ncbi:MAG: thioredoxin-dependent thiol peroxidase [Brevinema sp.]